MQQRHVLERLRHRLENRHQVAQHLIIDSDLVLSRQPSIRLGASWRAAPQGGVSDRSRRARDHQLLVGHLQNSDAIARPNESMIRKNEYRFSEKIMLKQKDRAG
jgi:hypothetical protein